MDKDSIYLLQCLDCNCNDCIFMQRDIEKYKEWDKYYMENGKVQHPSYRIMYGKCTKFEKEVTFIPNLLQLETQRCFEHRRKKDFEHLNEHPLLIETTEEKINEFI